MQRRALSLMTVILALATFGPPAFAGTQARLKGVVVTTSGVPIPEAEITITTDELTDFSKSVQVEADGTFSTLILDATRSYTFHVEAPGYVPYEEPFKVPAGSTDNEFTFTLTTRQEMAATEKAKLLEQPGYRELDEGMKLLEAGREAEACAKLQAAVAAREDLIPAWVALADIAYRAGRHEEALEYASSCLEVDDEALKCLAIAVNASEAAGRTAAHKKLLARYRELNPGDPTALFNEAAELLNQMNDAEARPLLEQCLELDPDFANCLFEYGMLLLRAGDMEGAKEHLERYLEVAPEGADATTAAETLKYL